jgi:hypothetical protein
MRFTRFAPAALMVIAVALLFFPWAGRSSGFNVWASIFDETRHSNELMRALFVLFLPYPFALILGAIVAFVAPPSVERAVTVGITAGYALIVLTVIFLYELCREQQAILDLSTWFYLSHAASLVCVALCIREYNQSSGLS